MGWQDEPGIKEEEMSAQNPRCKSDSEMCKLKWTVCQISHQSWDSLSTYTWSLTDWKMAVTQLSLTILSKGLVW